jgi:murein DD-endopeptidase MepM/ murein hydrolase activator NlpD
MVLYVNSEPSTFAFYKIDLFQLREVRSLTAHFVKLYYADGRWYFHNGIDIAVERGTEVVASTSGKVKFI